MAPLSSFSPSIWRPWRFLPWSPCLHLKLHGTPLVLFSVNLAPLTFSSLEPLLALETAWHPSRPFLRQFGAPEIFFPGAPACTWNCIWRPSRPFLRQFGAPVVFFPGAPACTWNCMAPLSSYWFNLLSFFFFAPSFFLFFFLVPFFSSFFPSLFLSFSFFSFFLAPLWWPRGAQAPKPPQDTRLNLRTNIHRAYVHMAEISNHKLYRDSVSKRGDTLSATWSIT